MKKWMKRVAYAVGSLVGLVIVGLATIYGLSEARFRKTYLVPTETVAVSSDSATLERGKHLATAIAKCTECHGERLEGRAVIDAPPMGRVVALNLTSGEGGIGAQLTPADIERAIRHGVGRNGRGLLIMPANDYQYMTDDDLRAIVSYVKQAPAVNNVLAPSRLMMLPRALMVFGQLPVLTAEEIVKSAVKPMTMAAGPTVEYGGYIAMVGGCKGCHGPNLSGGKIAAGDPAWPPSANLTREGNIGRWTEEQFVQVLRSGARPDGSKLNDAMPWKLAGQMTDVEMHALYTYLRSVPPRAFGNH